MILRQGGVKIPWAKASRTRDLEEIQSSPDSGRTKRSWTRKLRAKRVHLVSHMDDFLLMVKTKKLVSQDPNSDGLNVRPTGLQAQLEEVGMEPVWEEGFSWA